MFRFRRGKEPTTSSSDPHGHDHDHLHEHDEVEEAFELAETKAGRKKLLVASIGNTALMGFATVTALKSGSDPTAIEAIHNFGDLSYYLVPWVASMRTNLNSRRALRWMRGTSWVAATLAASSVVHSGYEFLVNDTVHPGAISVPAQAIFAASNFGIALYVGKEPGSTTIDQAALRHAKNDARTSVVAGLGNAAALAFSAMNPISGAIVGTMTVLTERTTINESTAALHKIDEATS